MLHIVSRAPSLSEDERTSLLASEVALGAQMDIVDRQIGARQ
jgi:hypothetical protein